MFEPCFSQDDAKAGAAVFFEFDKNKDDYLDRLELANWVVESNEAKNKKKGKAVRNQVEDMLRGVDDNGDKRVSLDEWTRFILSLNRKEGAPTKESVEALLAEEQKKENKEKKKRPIVTPPGMSEDEARQLLEANDATRQEMELKASKKKKKKKKKRKKGIAKEEL